MKFTKLIAALTVGVVLAVSSAQAAEAPRRQVMYTQTPRFDPLHTLSCGIWIIPNRCSPADRIVGTTLVGAGLGLGIGAIVGAGGSTLATGSLLAAKSGTAAVAWTGATLGAGAGFVGGVAVSSTAIY